jgi:hypothetical protein
MRGSFPTAEGLYEAESAERRGARGAGKPLARGEAPNKSA